MFCCSHLGVGVRGGCEALIHTVRALLEQNEEAEILQVNFRNAFNEADSAIAFNELKKHFPELTHLVASCYGVAAHLVYGDTNIPSTTSFHQGDALAVLLFALTLQPIILKILDEVPSLKTNSWFLDDGILAGTREELVKAVRILLEEGPAHGLQLSTEHVVPYPGTSKCALWCGREGPKETDPLGIGILPIEGPGFVHLGAPVGSIHCVQGKAKEQVQKVQDLLLALPTLENAHGEFALLRSCFSLPKVCYLLRTCPPTLSCLMHWSRFDSLMRDSMNRILGASLSDTAWVQSQLPVADGGLGLQSATDHCSAAFLASVISSESLVSQVAPSADLRPLTAEALEHLSSVLGCEETVPLESLLGSL